MLCDDSAVIRGAIAPHAGERPGGARWSRGWRTASRRWKNVQRAAVRRGGARHRNAGDGRDDGAAAAAARRSRAARGHGEHADHARRRHRAAGAAAGRGRLRARSPRSAAIADDSFRRELLAKVKGLARLRRRAPRRRRPRRAGRPPAARRAGRAARRRGCWRSAARPAGRRRCSPSCRGWAAAAGAGGADPAHAADLHADPGRAPDQARRPALRRGARRRGAACRPHPSGPGRPASAGGRPAGALRARLSDGPPENFCRPAVDPMLRSAAAACGGRGAGGDADRHGP